MLRVEMGSAKNSSEERGLPRRNLPGEESSQERCSYERRAPGGGELFIYLFIY
jgi:hypothetical protein